MREGWRTERFDNVFELQMGKTPSRNNPAYFNGDNVWVSIADLKGKYINDSKEYISDEAISDTGIAVVPANTVIMSFKLSVGKCAITTKELYTNEAIMSFRPKVDYSLIPDFIYYFLKGYHWQGANKAVMGITLNKKSISNNIFSFPPLPTQQQIVEELDLLSGIIEKQKAQLKELDCLAQSLFYDMFGDPVTNEKGWEVKKLGEISTLICNGNTPKGGSEVYVNDGILFIRSQNVWKNSIVLDDVAYIDYETHKQLHKSSLKHNDILITKTGRFNTENSSLGRSALFEGEDDSANINGHVYLVRLAEGVLHKFVLYILISDSYKELIRRTCVGGIDKRQLNKDHIEDFPIIFPPYELQDSYVSYISSIEHQKSLVKQSLKETETLFNSRMDYYFN